MVFEDIEDQIITKLKELTYLKTVETYAGQLEEGEIKKFLVNFPAVLVAYSGSNYEWIDGPNYNEACDFSVLVCAKNVRGNKAIRKAAAGCYQMIEDVKAKLINQTFGLEIEKLKILRVQLVGISQTTAIYGIDFQTNFDTTFNW
jgi:phage gp37-like protein